MGWSFNGVSLDDGDRYPVGWIDGLSGRDVIPGKTWDERIIEACAEVWRLRQVYGIANVDVDWYEPGEKSGNPVATVTIKTKP